LISKTQESVVYVNIGFVRCLRSAFLNPNYSATRFFPLPIILLHLKKNIGGRHLFKIFYDPLPGRVPGGCLRSFIEDCKKLRIFRNLKTTFNLQLNEGITENLVCSKGNYNPSKNVFSVRFFSKFKKLIT
jgi:hypothetical protein